MAEGKAGVQTALAASLCAGPCALGLRGDTKTTLSEPAGESFSPSGSSAALEGWDLILILPIKSVCTQGAFAGAWCCCLLHVSHFASSISSQTDSKHRFWGCFGGFWEGSCVSQEYLALSRAGGWKAACQGRSRRSVPRLF